jgi:hypothetical protein
MSRRRSTAFRAPTTSSARRHRHPCSAPRAEQLTCRRAPNGFNFDRLGIRIPTVLISPMVPAGTVVHEPTGPTATSHYDATSVIATSNALFGIAVRGTRLENEASADAASDRRTT